MSGALKAGDRLLVDIIRSTLKELRGHYEQIFHRKAFGVLSPKLFVMLYTLVMSVFFPEWSYFVSGEAYSSIVGMHLTPFSIHQLRRAKTTNVDIYFKMQAFNNVLSSQRITIKHAFGIFDSSLGNFAETDLIRAKTNR